MRTRIWLAAAAAALLAAAPAAAAPAGVVYGGVTPQQWPVVVQLARNGHSLTKVVLALSLKCGHGDPIVNKDRFDTLALTRSGRFSDRYGPTTTQNGDGTTTDYTGSLSGRVTSTKVTARSRLTGAFYDATGKLLDTCDSGTVAWTARP